MAESPSTGAARQVGLEQISFPRLLFALLRQRFTGCLRLEQRGTTGEGPASHVRTVWFRGGMPLFTDWVSPGLVLGQLMLRDRLLEDGQLVSALQSMAEHGGLLGETLVAQGAVDHRTVVEGLRRQCSAKLVEMFALRRGTITLSGCPREAAEELASVNVLELIRQGVAEHYGRERIAEEMRDALRGRICGTVALERYRQHFRFRDDDGRTLDAIARGGVTMEQLERLAASPDRAARIVYTLWACQMLRVGAEATSSAAPRARITPRPPSVPAPVAKSPPPSAPPPAPDATSSADEGFVGELTALEAKIAAGVHPFELLGIPIDAGKKEIRRAFGDLSRTFHPDGLQAKGLGHLRERVNTAFAALSEAQMLLADKDKREALRQRIERGEDPKDTAGSDPTAMARAAIESEVIAKEADKLLRAGHFARALERYEQAATLAPDEDDLQAALTWCHYNLSDKSIVAAARAEAALASITKANPKLARAHYFRGLVLKDLGRRGAAIDALNKAHEHDPRLVDAERQARILRMRQSGPQAATGRGKPDTGSRFGLKGLFGKK